MSELIKRADLLNHLNKCLVELGGQSMVVDTVLRAVKSAVEEMPTVDAVPVVRCKGCNFAYRTGSVIELYDCRACVTGECHDPYFFCSYGERRNDD